MNLPEWVYKVPWAIVQDISQDFGLDHLIVASIIMVESSGNPCAVRFEPGWKYHWKVKDFAKMIKSTVQTEEKMQATSFGYMQVIGTVAREHGHEGYLTDLCDPKIGITYGCKHLKKKLLKYGSIEDAVAAYNAGNVRKKWNGKYDNQHYVDKVMTYYKKFNDFIEGGK